MKRKLINFMLVGFVTILLSACAATDSGVRVDGTSAASAEKGIMTIQRNLRDKEQFEFTAALLAIQLSEVASVTDFLADPSLQSLNYEKIAKKINGMTYREIMALAKKSQTSVKIIGSGA